MMDAMPSESEPEFDPELEPELSAINSRASGRPPEEEESEDPERQAQVILEDSEERMSEGAEKSTES
jgi:hypothetical protein